MFRPGSEAEPTSPVTDCVFGEGIVPDAEIVMPVKDLVGRPRLTAQEAGFLKDIVERIKRGRRGGSDGGEPIPVEPPSGPSPLPLANAAEPDED